VDPPEHPPVDPPEDPPTPPEDPGLEDDEFLDENETPLAGIEDEEELEEPEVPLSPFTGDDRHTNVWVGVSLLSLVGIAVLARRRKEEVEE
jgi:hypothetical protein